MKEGDGENIPLSGQQVLVTEASFWNLSRKIRRVSGSSSFSPALQRMQARSISIPKLFMPPPLCAKKILPNFQPKKGFATLLAILVILAAGVSFALLSLSLATGLTRSTLDLEKYKEAQTLTDLCAELSIEKIKDDPDFTGEENFPLTGTNAIIP